VPFDQFSECYFRPSSGVLAKQFIVRLHIHFIAPVKVENRTTKIFLTLQAKCANVTRNSLQDSPCRNEN
jgi:hypothetical protein